MPQRVVGSLSRKEVAQLCWDAEDAALTARRKEGGNPLNDVIADHCRSAARHAGVDEYAQAEQSMDCALRVARGIRSTARPAVAIALQAIRTVRAAQKTAELDLIMPEEQYRTVVAALKTATDSVSSVEVTRTAARALGVTVDELWELLDKCQAFENRRAEP